MVEDEAASAAEPPCYAVATKVFSEATLLTLSLCVSHDALTLIYRHQKTADLVRSMGPDT